MNVINMPPRVWKPTAAQLRAIRAYCAKVEGMRPRQIVIELGERYNIDDPAMPHCVNLCRVSKQDPMDPAWGWDDTDLNQHWSWDDLKRGIELDRRVVACGLRAGLRPRPDCRGSAGGFAPRAAWAGCVRAIFFEENCKFLRRNLPFSLLAAGPAMGRIFLSHPPWPFARRARNFQGVSGPFRGGCRSRLGYLRVWRNWQTHWI